MIHQLDSLWAQFQFWLDQLTQPFWHLFAHLFSQYNGAHLVVTGISFIRDIHLVPKMSAVCLQLHNVVHIYTMWFTCHFILYALSHWTHIALCTFYSCKGVPAAAVRAT